VRAGRRFTAFHKNASSRELRVAACKLQNRLERAHLAMA
jgi:hypothetical protein